MLQEAKPEAAEGLFCGEAKRGGAGVPGVRGAWRLRSPTTSLHACRCLPPPDLKAKPGLMRRSRRPSAGSSGHLSRKERRSLDGRKENGPRLEATPPDVTRARANETARCGGPSGAAQSEIGSVWGGDMTGPALVQKAFPIVIRLKMYFLGPAR